MTDIRIYLTWPVEISSPISQRFGENPNAYAAFGLKGHNGMDFAIPMGTPIGAAQGGVIDRNRYDPGGYGNYVRIKHTDGAYYTLYAHLDKSYVKEGQYIMAGVILGESGNTGNSTGPHLHFELRIPGHGVPGYNDAVDPLPFLNGGQIVVPPPTSNDLPAPTQSGTVLVTKLYLRQEPKALPPSIGSLPKGISVIVYELIKTPDGNVWARLGKEIYAAQLYNNNTYMEISPICHTTK